MGVPAPAPRWPLIDRASVRQVVDLLESGHTVALGRTSEVIRKAEDSLSAYHGGRHVLTTNSGHAALMCALMGLEIGDGDEVITTPCTWGASTSCILGAGAVPVFADVDRVSGLLDPKKIEAAITPRTKAVLVVHLYGQPVDLDAFLAVASRHSLRLVEDCSHAHGAFYRGQHVGTFGDVGCFSFYPTKNLGAFGDGGICVTDDYAIAGRLRGQRMYGYREDSYSHEEGLNSRLDSIQAAILRVKLAHLDHAVSERRELAAYYREGLSDRGYRMQSPTEGGKHAYHLYVIRTPVRAETIIELRHAGVGVGIHYPLAIHEMAAYTFLDRPGELSVSEQVCKRVISLPLYPGMPAGVQKRVLDALPALDEFAWEVAG